MKVTYIFHSGFAIETENANLVFDCFKDPLQVVDKIVRTNGKPLYFFSSHRHPDHFNPEIFRYAKERTDANYILSADIRRTIKKENLQIPQNCSFLKQGDTYSDQTVKASAFPSTDIGVSFCIENSGKSIFHAGDLNLWHWKEESTEAEIRKATGDFKAALRSIHNAGFQSFFVAMFPVDGRLGKDYYEGAKIFVDEFYVEHFFPMHFWDDSEKIEEATRFECYKNKNHGNYHALTSPSQSIII